MTTLESLRDLTVSALETQGEAAAERQLAAWLERHGAQPAVLHWRALLLRGLDRHGEALALLHAAQALAPGDAEIARNLAQVALEAGVPADALFEQALQRDPANVPARRGLVSAYFAAGKGQQGLDLLRSALQHNPLWYDGHAQFAQLATLVGQSERALDTLKAALLRAPDVLELHAQLLGLQLMAGQFAAAETASKQAIARLGEIPLLLVDRAAAADELGRSDIAAALFAKAGPPADIGHATWLLRHHLRSGNPGAALTVAEPWLAGAGAPQVWPYVSLAWRLLGDAHADWLEQQHGLVMTVDLADQINLPALGRTLRRIHEGSGRYVDQSVRGGTQTDGPLFSRIEPEIVATRQVIAGAMAAHLAGLDQTDPRHPQLALPRDQDPRFSGSWSVRLQDQGFHTSHHHPMGWFSAVLYVTVPETLHDQEGQLVLGAPPPELGLDLAPFRNIAPKPGLLAIFPSTMWHATLPYSAGERMTIAFDTARPYIGDGL